MTDDQPSILTPDAIKIANDERVEQLSSRRHVIKTEEKRTTEEEQHPLRSQQTLSDQPYALHIVGRFGDEDKTAETQIGNQNVAKVFDKLITWYAAQVSSNRSVEETIRILCDHSEIIKNKSQNEQ